MFFRKGRRIAEVLLILTVVMISSVPVWADDFHYSDKELMTATQIAYYTFTEEQLAAHGGSATVRELLLETDTRARLEEKYAQEVKKNQEEGNSGLEKKMAEWNLRLYEEIVEEHSPYGNWKVAAVKNHNMETGFYGVLLDTDGVHGLISFRGSESTDMNQVVKDWMSADAGLLMAKDTLQQEEAAAFMEEINERFSYEWYGVTGHSLGGNLACHAVIAAPDGMRGKLQQAVSFDGPGYSMEYMERNGEFIQKVTIPVVHYQWSLVGALLNQPSCVSSRTVQVTEDIRPFQDLDSNYMRHAVSFLYLNGEQVMDSRRDLVSAGMASWSKTVDQKVMEKRRENAEQAGH
uniref:Mbeg1-like protein n=1 Tax=Candidatus Ventrimonas sp. TaxID=3048889 RepID=UPI003FED4D91